jgi:alpha-glucosidase (family GH31 glycosyl hydrolase)
MTHVRFLIVLSALAGACATADRDPEDRSQPFAPLAPPEGCPAGPVEPVAVPGAYPVGDFEVVVDRDAWMWIEHDTDGSAQSAAQGGPLFSAAASTLVVDEHQGSFAIEADVDRECLVPIVENAAGGAGRLLLGGRFDDCPSVQWSMSLCQAGDGQLWFGLGTSDPELDELRLHLTSDAGERIFGMGEQFAHDRIDLKGRAIPVLSQEGGIGRGHTPITQAVNLASSGSGGSEASTYYAAPHYLTSRLRSLFLENTEYALFDFRGRERLDIRVHAAAITGRVLAGRSPLELIERFTAWAGRMPPLPDWANRGAIVALARDLDDSRAIVDQLRGHGAAIAAVWNQTWSGKVDTFIGEQVLWNWIQSPTFHPGWDAFVADLAADGIRTLCYVNPMLVEPPAEAGPVRRNLYAEAAAAGYLVRDPDGDIYRLPVTAFEVGLLDLTSDPAWAWMKSVIRDEMIDRAGCSGWMADFGEALPFDAVLASGVDAARYHNQYPVDWIRLNREAVEEAGGLGDLLVFNRSGAARTPRHAMLLWEGDQLTTWDKYDGLVSALRGLVSGGFSGIALNHSDTGGYTSLSLSGIAGYEREPEQLMRWTEMNAFTAALRTHEGNQPGVNAQVYSSAEAMRHFARFTRVYRALAFYREQLHAEAAARGWPVVRHLWMEFPGDTRAQTIDDQFMLGSELLVAPIKNKCWTWPWCPYDKSVYLPTGRWVHLWSGELHGDPGAGSIVRVKAPIGEPAVFYRAGSPVAARFIDNLRAEGITVADAR